MEWVAEHSRVLLLLFALACLAYVPWSATVDRAQSNDLERQNDALEQIIARVEGDRIASDLASCEAGNRLRRDIREAIAGLAQRQFVIDYFAERFAPTNCAERINPGAPSP